MSDVVMWGIHAGHTGDADELFKKGFIAIGWEEMGDMSKLPNDREAFKAAIAKANPTLTPPSVANQGGQVYRFVCEMKPGDYVVYPSKRYRRVHIGLIEGPYRYDPALSKGYPNLRKAKWLKDVPRTAFSQGALYEIGSALSLFRVKNYADEFLAATETKVPKPPEADPTIKVVAEEIENNTRDFVLMRLARELKGHPLADFVAHLLTIMGYRTRVSPEGPDGGVDILAHKDELGFEPPIIKVQVKSTEGSVGDPVVSALYGKVGATEHGLLVTLGTYTPQAQSFAKSKTNLRLIDGEELVDLILSHYEQLDSRYKGIIPLKRVYAPEPVTDEEE
jgi:restriction system protein